MSAAPGFVSLNYFDQSVYLNIQTIIANLKSYTSQAIAETKSELGAWGVENYNSYYQSYDGWAISNGAPQIKSGAWNWYLQNKILGGIAPQPHEKRVCRQVRTNRHPILRCTTTPGISPIPSVGSLSTFTNNINLTAQNLQTELNRVHLPTPPNFNAWTNVIANYSATSLEGVGLVNLFNALMQFKAWLSQISNTVASAKQAALVAQQQYAAAQKAAQLAQQTVAQAQQTVTQNTQQAAANAKNISASQTSAMQTAQNQLQQANAALNLATNAAQVSSNHASVGNINNAVAASQIAVKAANTAAILSQAAGVVTNAGANPTSQNIAAATTASNNAASAVNSLNNTSKKTSLIVPAAIIGAVALAAKAGLIAL